MRNLKWLYACSLAIAFGVLSFTAVSCHDDDDEPKQEPKAIAKEHAYNHFKFLIIVHFLFKLLISTLI